MINKKQQFMIFGLAVGLVCGFVFAAYLPIRRSLKELRGACEEAKAALASGETQGKQMPGLKKQLAEQQVRVGDYSAKIPADRSIGNFLQQVTSLMNQCDLKDQQILPGQEVRGKSLSCIPVSIQCKGSMKQVFEFFKSLKTMERVTGIEMVKLDNDDDFTGQVSMQSRANIYYSN
jgi:Tfp pilus assembly protein PilO